MAFGYADGDEADVVGVGYDADGAAVVEGDVELAGEAVEVARVEDVVVEGLGQWGDVIELGWVEAGDGRGGDVTDVVRAGAAGGHAERLNRREDANDVFGLELADLEVAASGDVGATGAVVSGQSGEAAKLMGGEYAAGYAEAEHEGVLRGGDVEEAVELEAEEVVRGGSLVFAGVCEEFVPDVEGVLVVLPALFAAEIGDGGSVEGLFGFLGGLIREAGRGVGGDEPGCSVSDEGKRLPLCDGSEEFLQVRLLICGECRV